MIKIDNDQISPSSFRDRSGFVFFKSREIFRQVNKDYKNEYEHLINSGLYDELTKKGLLIPHSECTNDYALTEKAYKVIKPQKVSFISYPYEWCFSEYKDAALTTLEIQKSALKYGMSLKDASAYNIQFFRGKPVLIDTLSFERQPEGKPWIAYRQFCQHFLAPLSLMSYKDVRLNQLMRIFIDGIPLDLVSSLLPIRSRFKFSILSHIHLHSKAQKRYAEKGHATNNRKMSKYGLIGIIDNLQSSVKNLNWVPEKTEWSDYYDKTNYTEQAFNHKKEIVSRFLDVIKDANTLWDLGSNTGEFSRVACTKGFETVSFDADPSAVEKNYLGIVNDNEKHVLPLLCDLTNPSPDIGWENNERASLLKRSPVDIALALALIHHLAISNNVPIDKISKFFYRFCRYLIIEFIPKTDSMVQKLLSTREDIFDDYTENSFKKVFEKQFSVINSVKIYNTERTIYLMKKIEN